MLSSNFLFYIILNIDFISISYSHTEYKESSKYLMKNRY